MSTSRKFKTSFKPNLTCIFLSVRVKWKKTKHIRRPCSLNLSKVSSNFRHVIVNLNHCAGTSVDSGIAGLRKRKSKSKLRGGTGNMSANPPHILNLDRQIFGMSSRIFETILRSVLALTTCCTHYNCFGWENKLLVCEILKESQYEEKLREEKHSESKENHFEETVDGIVQKYGSVRQRGQLQESTLSNLSFFVPIFQIPSLNSKLQKAYLAFDCQIFFFYLYQIVLQSSFDRELQTILDNLTNSHDGENWFKRAKIRQNKFTSH